MTALVGDGVGRVSVKKEVGELVLSLVGVAVGGEVVGLEVVGVLSPSHTKVGITVEPRKLKPKLSEL
jgi:hypothetical protein